MRKTPHAREHLPRPRLGVQELEGGDGRPLSHQPHAHKPPCARTPATPPHARRYAQDLVHEYLYYIPAMKLAAYIGTRYGITKGELCECSCLPA